MMPFYGDVAQFILAVDSVRSQRGEWRLVILDDVYPDAEPRRYVEALADPRIVYVVNERNLGISGNFQRSIELAEAEFTVIMGCDDIMLSGYVIRMTALISQFPDAAYFQPGVATIDDNGIRSSPLGDRVKSLFRPKGKHPARLSGEKLAASLLQGNWTYFPSLCWRTDVLAAHGFREEFRIVLDLALQLSIIEDGGVLVLDDTVVFEYRRHSASASSWAGSGSGRFKEEKELFRQTAETMRSKGWNKASRAARVHLTSRLNALTQLPGAIVGRESEAVKSLSSHAFSRG
ncbi:Glycosyl transferase family 2 [Salinibacterium xinjiangense]|uniref:Glycosyl transferase family 2 n=2 Tax=Salinibacterium xinjiangense TaxID=386302 RepID=A0A2C8Y6Z1_9MICO|nr:Glycosyl transferase family 2 [Salinibacterium xinjiangense]